MKLVFYSGGEARDNTHLDSALLSDFKGMSPSLTFIPTCSFHAREDFEDIIDQYQALGVKKFSLFEVDQPFSETMRKAVLDSDIIYLGGGNTFYFLKHLRRTKLLKDLKDYVKSGGILAGLSAGAIMMTKKIDTAGFPSFDCDENDENLKNLKSMHLVDFEFFPHYKNSKRYDQELLAYSKQLDNPLYACPDGSGIILEKEEIRFMGKTICFFNGKKYFVNK